jgi:hypothetical protein
VLMTRRRALGSGLALGLLAVLGCSDSSTQMDSARLEGMTPGQYRDKNDELTTQPPRKSRRSRAGR